MERTRPPAVAGLFYPASPQALRGEVVDLLRTVPPAAEPREGRIPKAILAPHAGYRYSGPIAARAFAPLAGVREIERVVLLGPAHRVPFGGLALPGVAAFATPLGEVPVDAEPEEVAEVLDRVWGGPETLVVVSSDLSHYLHRDMAREIDRRTVDRILALDGPLDPREACGARPLGGLLVAARRHGLEAHLLDLRNSADTAGDPERVVGYAAVAFYEKHPRGADADC